MVEINSISTSECVSEVRYTDKTNFDDNFHTMRLVALLTSIQKKEREREREKRNKPETRRSRRMGILINVCILFNVRNRTFTLNFVEIYVRLVCLTLRCPLIES
jgi:hypothetical protein